MMMTIGVMVTIAVAMTTQLRLENEAHLTIAIVMMMRHHGMQQDNRTRQRDHYFSHQIFHTMTHMHRFAAYSHDQRHCKNTKKNIFDKKNFLTAISRRRNSHYLNPPDGQSPRVPTHRAARKPHVPPAAQRKTRATFPEKPESPPPHGTTPSPPEVQDIDASSSFASLA